MARSRTAEERVVAFVYVDTSEELFPPITSDLPLILFPVVTTPVLQYIYDHISAAGVDTIFLFCTSYSEEVEQFADNLSSDQGRIGPLIQVHFSANCKSVGSAFREIADMGIIQNDFIFIDACVVSNIDIGKLYEKHKSRRKKSKQLLMTMSLRVCHPSETDIVVTYDKKARQLLGMTNTSDERQICIDTTVIQKSSVADIRVRSDLTSCHICICNPEVLVEFKDNFDYDDLNHDFVHGTLAHEEAMGGNILVKIFDDKYSEVLHDFASYQRLSSDVLRRWSYPLAPAYDTAAPPSKYFDYGVSLARTCAVGDDVFIGEEAEVGDNTRICHSVVGRENKIGSNVDISDSILWDNVVIEDNVIIQGAIICSHAVVRKGEEIGKGCIVRSKREVVSTKDEQGEVVKSGIDVLPDDALSSPSLLYLSEESDSEEEDEEEFFVPREQRLWNELLDTVRRDIQQDVGVKDAIHEINGLKFGYNASFQECIDGIVNGMSDVVLLKGYENENEKVAEYKKIMGKYAPLLTQYIHSVLDQSKTIHSFVTFVKSSTAASEYFDPIFLFLVHMLYEFDVVEEEGVRKWVEEEEDEAYVQKCSKFLEWLDAAEEEEEDDDDDDEEEDESDEEEDDESDED